MKDLTDHILPTKSKKHAQWVLSWPVWAQMIERTIKLQCPAENGCVQKCDQTSVCLRFMINTIPVTTNGLWYTEVCRENQETQRVKLLDLAIPGKSVFGCSYCKILFWDYRGEKKIGNVWNRSCWRTLIK